MNNRIFITKIFSTTVCILALLVCSANAATENSPQIPVSAQIDELLEIGTWINREHGIASSGNTIDFGELQITNEKLQSPYWYEIHVWVATNIQSWTLTSRWTDSGSNPAPLPVGAIQVNGPITGGDIAANTGSSIDVANDQNQGTLSPDGAIIFAYRMESDSIPMSQISGNYGGSIVVTVTSNE